MASRSTLTVLLLFVVFISKSYGWPTYCDPYAYYFEDIRTHLQSVAPKYGVPYSGEKEDTSSTVQRLLERFNRDQVKQIIFKQSIRKYTADKMKHYKVIPSVKGSASELDDLKHIFRLLDDKYFAYLTEIEQYQKKFVEKEQELNIATQQIQTLNDTIVVLEKMFHEGYNTLSKTREIQTNLQKTIKDRGLQ